MTALDVDPATHKLTIRWQWNCNTDRGDSSDDWYGNGYHNFGIADVDLDGRDEIVYGSMVIDDNGLGLHTTGLGHGDAQHCSDFDPYTHGLEIFAALEDHPGNNFRDATTGKIYYRYVAGDDDGRCMMGNFSNSVLGAQGVSSRDPNVIGAVAKGPVSEMEKSNITQNFRIYWDGDLLEETFDYSNGKNSAGHIVKYGVGEIAVLTGSMTNNDTKGTPCYQGDILGDWREEVIMRTSDNNIRIYTTPEYTPWRIYSLWHGHQYRNAMVWQMCGYNQPPHKSYFLGELEGMTIAPPPLTNTGRTVLTSGATLSSANDDEHVLLAETSDATLNVSGKVSPYIVTLNVPTWVQGHDDNDNITTTVYSLDLNGEGELSGEARLVKQGDGVLNISETVALNHSGETNIWAGTLNYNGDIPNSSIWGNRFVALNIAGNMGKSVSMEYASTLNAGGENEVDTLAIADTLSLNYGAALGIDILDSDKIDFISASVLKLSTFGGNSTGLAYSTPIVRFNVNTNDGTLPGGKYAIGKFDAIDGDVSSIVVEGSVLQKFSLSFEDSVLYLNVMDTRPATIVKWIGDESKIWETSNTESNLNFEIAATGEKTYFVPGDTVIFSDDAKNYTVSVEGTVNPAIISFDNTTADYKLEGGSIIGGSIEKKGAGNVVIGEMLNSFKGGTIISEGALSVSNLAYSNGTEDGALGNIESPIILDGGTLTTTGAVNCSNKIVIGENDGTINNQAALLLTKEVSAGDTYNWYKTGSGTLTLSAIRSSGILHAVGGVVQASETSDGYQSTPAAISFEGGTVKDANNSYSYTTNATNYIVPEGKTGTLYVDGRCTYTGKLTGQGTLIVYPTFARTSFKGDWSAFEGTVSVMANNSVDFIGDNGMPKARLVTAGSVMSYEEGASKQLSSFAIGSLTGTGVLYGGSKCVYSIGSDNTDFTFDGTINTGSFKKVGTGVFTLSKPQTTLTSAPSVEDGVLYLSGSTTDNYINNMELSVNGNATLAGNVTLGEVKVNGNGTVKPGKYPSNGYYGSMTFTRLEMQAGTTLALSIRTAAAKAIANKTSNSYVTVSKVLTLRGNIDIEVSENYNPAPGDTFLLWTCQLLNVGNNTTVNLPALPEGLAWDTSDLLKETGILRVVSTTAEALPLIGLTEEVNSAVYDLTGRKVMTLKGLRKDVQTSVADKAPRSGIYIVVITSASATESIKVRVKK